MLKPTVRNGIKYELSLFRTLLGLLINFHKNTKSLESMKMAQMDLFTKQTEPQM